MSKKPYDLLASDKELFLYREKTMIRMDDGFLVALKGREGKEIIAPASHLLLLLGAGTSISQDAAIFCAFNDMHVAFARGGCNVHSLFMSGRYQSPESIMNQANLVATKKLEIARLLMRHRLKRQNQQTMIDDMLKQPDIVSLISWEGRWAKNVYKHMALKNNIMFTRTFDALDDTNAKLNLLNNALYSICTAICLSCGLHPSLGFIHGLTRRGGLAFDLADILKNDTTLPLAFDKEIKPGKLAMYKMTALLKEHNEARVKTLIALCLCIASGDVEGLEALC